jgi:2-aminoethylphosphonate-pyruvate transaminase
MQNHEILVRGLSELSIKSVVGAADQSYIITTFELGDINFDEMYEYLKQKGFLIYPGKMTDLPTFRVGNIGDVYPDDMRVLLRAMESFLTDARKL